jgi:hypothetical protein
MMSVRPTPALRGRRRPRRGVLVGSGLATLLMIGACAIDEGAQGATRAAPKRYPDRLAGTFNGFCQQREDDGFEERAALRVVRHQVQALTWQTVVGRRGSCTFDLAEFRQTRSRPHLELLASDGTGCRLLVYQDARRVTLAHSNCSQRCTPGIYEQAWPVMFDPASGRCARLDR